MQSQEFNPFTVPPSGEYSDAGARKLAVDLEQLGGLLSHLRRGITNPTLYPYIREIVDIARESPARFDRYHPIQPIAEVFHMPTPSSREGGQLDEESLAFGLSFLRRRANLTKGLLAFGGQARVGVDLETMPSFEIVLNENVHYGGNQFHLLASEPGEKDTRLYLGSIDIDYLDKDTLLVNELWPRRDIAWIETSDTGSIEEYDFLPDDYDWTRKDRVTLAALQEGILRTTQQGRVKPHAASEATGSEELLIYSSLAMLIRAGVLEQNAKVVIPRAELTYYASGDGLILPRQRALEATISNFSAEDKEMLADIMRADIRLDQKWIEAFGNTASYEEFYLRDSIGIGTALVDGARNYLEREKGRVSQSSRREADTYPTLPQFVGRLLMRAIPDELNPTEKELEQFGFYNNFSGDRKQFERFIAMLTMRTPQFLSQYPQFMNVFSDDTINAEYYPFGRIVPAKAITELPFAQHTHIEPVTT